MSNKFEIISIILIDFKHPFLKVFVFYIKRRSSGALSIFLGEGLQMKCLNNPTVRTDFASSPPCSKSWQNVSKSSWLGPPKPSRKCSISKVSSNSFFMIFIMVYRWTTPDLSGFPPIATKASTIDNLK
jgi:hypothetical protein